jgi:hypothetical protein
MAKERGEMVGAGGDRNSGSTMIGFGVAKIPGLGSGQRGTEPCQERLGGRCACGS